MYHSLYTVHSHVYTTLDLGHWKFVVKYIPDLRLGIILLYYKLPLTSVLDSIYSEYTWRLWYIY